MCWPRGIRATAERTLRPLAQVTLDPGAKVEPAWPFRDLAPDDFPAGVVREPDNPREQLAAIMTSPRNERFAQVIVNRLWKRSLGWGLAEPVDDWSDPQPSHPDRPRDRGSAGFRARLARHDHCALGINPATELYAEDRPVPITDRGRPIHELFGG